MNEDSPVFIDSIDRHSADGRRHRGGGYIQFPEASETAVLEQHPCDLCVGYHFPDSEVDLSVY